MAAENQPHLSEKAIRMLAAHDRQVRLHRANLAKND